MANRYQCHRDHIVDVLMWPTDTSIIEPDMDDGDDDDDDEEGGDDIAQFNASQPDVTHPTIQPRSVNHGAIRH